MRRVVLMLAFGLGLLSLYPVAEASPGDRLDRANLVSTFAAEFNDPAGTPLDRSVWRTRYYFGAAETNPDGSRPPRSIQYLSRTISGEKEVYVDEDYCGRNPFHIADGVLTITARTADETEAATCGVGGRRTILSGLITTQTSFSQTFGYFEIRARLPTAQGSWPAFWLIPTTKTPTNLGRLPEFDVMEHWAGEIVLMSRGGTSPVTFNRTGQPIATLHYGVKGAEGSVTNAKQAQHLDVTQFHTYGLLWTPSRLIWYVDDVEVFETPFANADSHYLVANLAVDGRYPNPGPFPAHFVIDYIRAYKTRTVR